MVANTLKTLAVAIQLALNVFALMLVTAWPYNTFRRAGWPLIDGKTFLIGAALAVIVLGMIPVLYPRLCPDRNRFGRLLLLTGWPLTLFKGFLAAFERLPLIGLAGTAMLLMVAMLEALVLGLVNLACTIEKSPA